MTVEIKRKKGESFESMMRRFSRRMMQSKALLEIKTKRYKRRPQSRNRRRATTLSHKNYHERREFLKLTGRMKEDPADLRRRF